MKRHLITAVFAGVLLAIPAWAGTTPASGIVASPHDFTSSTNGAVQTDPNASICIFCHIQHRPGSAAPSTGSTRLLWNHKLSSQSFSWSDTTKTQGGTTLPTNLGSWAGSSKNCLSCHDGTVSVGDVYRGSFPASSFVGGTAYANGTGTVPNWTGSAVDSSGKATASYLKIGATGDMKGNHPVGIPYPYQQASSTYNGITTGTSVDLTDYVAQPVNVKLFTNSAGDVLQGAQAGLTGIECASCHDAHNKHTKDSRLLRDFYTASGGQPSQLCLDCHNK